MPHKAPTLVDEEKKKYISARDHIMTLCSLINREIVPIGGTASFKAPNMVSIMFGTSQPAILTREMAGEYEMWLEAGNKGTPDDFARRPLIPSRRTPAAIERENVDMRRALSEIRRLCYLISGLKDEQGMFILNPLAERIGLMSGRAIEAVRGKEAA